MGDHDDEHAHGAGPARAGEGRPRAGDPHPSSAEVAGKGAAELARLLDSGELTSTEVVEHLLARIEAVDRGEQGLRSVLELAPDALDAAAGADAERRRGRARGPLHGVPVLVKDNIDTAAPLHTTAGSLVFGDCPPAADAPLVAALRRAGAVVLGKTNLSEWANFRGRPSSSGWSAAGGQTRNPHALDRSPGGSSAGSGAAVAARLAPLAVGTETDGSIMCPSSACGVAGLKPTLGLVSRTGIVPIAPSQDTAGPMARTVEDLALLLEVLAGAVDDGEDDAARSGARPAGYRTDFRAQLGDGGLSDVRVGMVSGGGFTGYHAATDRVFASVAEAMRACGAAVVDPVEGLDDPIDISEAELTVLATEFGVAAPAYFRRRAEASPGCTHLPRTLTDVLAHATHEPRERLDLFGVELIARAAASEGPDDAYRAAREACLARAGRDGLDSLFARGGVSVLAVPAMGPAWLVDHLLGDHFTGAGWSPSAVVGYPSATVPMGAVEGLPVGVAILGRPWSEGLVLRVLAALERVLGPAVTSPVPAFAATRGPLL